ncbi:hypothetical protein HK102_003107 [Quaeritorhiza haematococci]|nr:hypothetical protein HK102_003107 [Quaeritorhiza haematococci]
MTQHLPPCRLRRCNIRGRPNKTPTEIASTACKSTLDHRLDFLNLSPSAHRDNIVEALRKSWRSHPKDALRLIFQLRDVRNGKANKKSFAVCCHYLMEKHPKTFFENLVHVPKHGYYTDLLKLLLWRLRNGKRKLNFGGDEAGSHKQDEVQRLAEDIEKLKTEDEKDKDTNDEFEIIDALAYAPKPAKPASTKPKKTKRSRLENLQASRAKRERLASLSPKEVARINAEHAEAEAKRAEERKKPAAEKRKAVKNQRKEESRRSDVEALAKKKSVLFAAKWAPTVGSSHDKELFMAFAIAKKLAPRNATESNDEYKIRALNEYRTKCYFPLRAATPVSEVFKSARKLDQIQYNRVTSICMKQNKNKFEEHDKERFLKYLDVVQQGKTTITSGALLPHQIVSDCMVGKSDTTNDLQWADYVRCPSQSGSLSDTLPVCDVSGSMSGTPMIVAIALSLLSSELNVEPWEKPSPILYVCNVQVATVRATVGVSILNFQRNHHPHPDEQPRYKSNNDVDGDFTVRAHPLPRQSP